MIASTYADAAIVLAGMIGTALIVAAAGWANKQ